MASFVTTGAMVTCSFGLTPCPLVVLPSRTVMLSGRPKANIMDFAPITNIASFGMCSAPTNPTVISATAAAMGVFTPMPCVPAIVTPWMPGKPDLLVQGMPALTNTSKTMCMWMGQISFTFNGQMPLPPLVCVAPPGKPIVPLPIRMPLTSADFAAAGGGGGGGSSQSSGSSSQSGGGSIKDTGGDGFSDSLEQQYNKDVKKAEAAGKQQEMMSKSCDKAAKEYTQAGQTEKATQAQKMAETALGTAADKKNEAVGDVNQYYRETMPPSNKQMEQLTPKQQQEYKQKRENIAQEKKQKHQEAEKTYEASRKDQVAATTRDLQIHYANKQEQNEIKQLNDKTFK